MVSAGGNLCYIHPCNADESIIIHIEHIYPLPDPPTCASIINTSITGGADQLQSLDVDVWEHLMTKARNAPLFYGSLFECLADSFLTRYYHTDRASLTISNIKQIYCEMVNYLSVF